MIERWNEWIAAFDRTVADDDWSRLGDFLNDDVVYCVQGAPFACEIRGRHNVVSAFARSIRGFDRKFDERRWFGVGLRVFEPGVVTGRAMGWYRLGDAPPLTFSANSQWLFRDDRLSVMTDIYDTSEADVMAALVALAQLGEGFDPSYC